MCKGVKENQDEINWYLLSKNTNDIDFLKANLNKIKWDELSFNPNAIKLLEENPDKINWDFLSSNPNAMHLLEANPDNVNLNFLSYNPNIKAIDMIRNLNKEGEPTNLECFTSFKMIFKRKYPNIMDKTLDTITISQKIEFILFCNALNSDILRNNLMLNPNVLSLILEWDYDRIKTHFYSNYGKELIEWIYNPIRNEKWSKTCWDLNI